MSNISFECSAVALCLSAVVRLRQAFEGSSSPLAQQHLLLAAGDVLDHTLPFPDLKSQLQHAGSQQVPLLVERRERIAFVPPGLWRAARVRPNELGTEHYSGLRNLERVLRREVSRPDVLWPALETWLAPAWSLFPPLAAECLALKSSLAT